MKKMFRFLDRIFEIFAPALFIVLGVTVLIFSGYDFVGNNASNILAIMLIVQGFAKIVDFVASKKVRKTMNFDMAFGIISEVMGVIFLVTNLSIENLCLIWGIYEIIEGAFEIQHIVIDLNAKEWVAVIELVIAIITIIFGVLLVLGKEEDIMAHLIALGVVLLLTAASEILGTIIEHKKDKTK
ncbi:MAG: DUF308 domain-containing protein [Bacilli bacterium]|nr:DUF308 domain-containing protein [Bacilli bacterium]